MAKTQAKQFVVCIDNAGYAASLEKRKIYIALRDAAAGNTVCFGSSTSPVRIISIQKSSSARLPCLRP
jgi:hypothetical protein